VIYRLSSALDEIEGPLPMRRYRSRPTDAAFAFARWAHAAILRWGHTTARAAVSIRVRRLREGDDGNRDPDGQAQLVRRQVLTPCAEHLQGESGADDGQAERPERRPPPAQRWQMVGILRLFQGQE